LFLSVKTGITKLNLGQGEVFEIKMQNLAVVVHVLRTTQNLITSRRCFAEDGKEIYQDLKRMCIAIVLLIKAFAQKRFRCRS